MGTQRLTERVSLTPMTGGEGFAVAVDEDAGVVRNVGVCGLVSENGRDYPLDVQRRDHPKYEGAKVFFDHTDERTGRKFRDWVGVLRRPNCVTTGSRADFEFFKSDPNVPKLLEAIRKCPEKFGLSHVANCKTRRQGGRDVVEAIESVESVDIVLNPATNPKGLFRHESKGAAVGKISLKQYAERVGPKMGPAKWGALVKLCEDFGDVADVPVVDEPAGDVAPEAGDLKTALMSALSPMLDEAFDSGDCTKLIAALKDFVKLHAKHTGKGGGGGGSSDDEGGSEEAEEGRKPTRITLAGLISEAQAGGLANPTAADLAVLEAIPTAAGRKAYCDRVRESAAPGERPRSSGKPPGAGPMPEKKPAQSGGSAKPVQESAAPSDPKAYAKWLQEA